MSLKACSVRSGKSPLQDFSSFLSNVSPPKGRRTPSMSRKMMVKRFFVMVWSPFGISYSTKPSSRCWSTESLWSYRCRLSCLFCVKWERKFKLKISSVGASCVTSRLQTHSHGQTNRRLECCLENPAETNTKPNKSKQWYVSTFSKSCRFMISWWFYPFGCRWLKEAK